MCERERERVDLSFPSLVLVESIVEGSVASDVYMCPCVCACMQTCARQCQCKCVQSVCVCAAVFATYCPPTGYLYREHDIKRDR